MRRSLIAIGALLLAGAGPARHAGVQQPSGLSPDGSILGDGSSTAQPPTSGTAPLNTAFGQVTIGPLFANTPHWGGGQIYVFNLNGRPMGPAQVFGGWQFVRVYYGGNLYALTFDEIWAQWVGHAWQGNSGGDHTTPPGTLGPVQSPPTTWAGPYTPSSDGSATTSAGGGTLTTADGVWSYGSVNGGGKNLLLNGTECWIAGSQSVGMGTVGTPFATTDMQVNSHGNLFFKTTDTNWHVWAGNQENASTGPTSAAIPINITFDASLVSVSKTVTMGTHIVGAVVTMSDGGSFSGTGSVGDAYDPGTGLGVAIASYDSGTHSLVTAWDSMTEPPQGNWLQVITLTQNGSSMSVILDFGVGP